jgi:hypothetical protein
LFCFIASELLNMKLKLFLWYFMFKQLLLELPIYLIQLNRDNGKVSLQETKIASCFRAFCFLRGASFGIQNECCSKYITSKNTKSVVLIWVLIIWTESVKLTAHYSSLHHITVYYDANSQMMYHSIQHLLRCEYVNTKKCSLSWDINV